MTTRVKICGLKSAEAVAAALESRADLVGFVFYGRSPRNVALETAAGLAEFARGMAATVALTVDADDALLDEISRIVNPDMFQLHGEETPERVRAVRQRLAKPVMKAIPVATAADAERALAYLGAADLILFDSRPAPGDKSALPGGNGVPFDWRAIAAVKNRVPYILSGGLTPDNVAEAVRLTGASAVDVSSGVERAPGDKDPELIRRFIHAAKHIRPPA